LEHANDDVPVLDRRGLSLSAADQLDARDGEWSPPKTRIRAPGIKVSFPGERKPDPITADSKPEEIDAFIAQGKAWYSSNRFDASHDNDNQDWPLAKLLKTENELDKLVLAIRYRQLHNATSAVVDLVGKDMADNVYLVHRSELDESTGRLKFKEVKQVTGKKANVETSAKRKVVTFKGKGLASPVAKPFVGDEPINRKIDAESELAWLRSRLGLICRAFEAAVIDGHTLQQIGTDHGVGNPKGASGAGRALVFLGFTELESCWAQDKAPKKPVEAIAA
jgi:hypothetical protein